MDLVRFTSPVLDTNCYLAGDGGEAMAVDVPYGMDGAMVEEAGKRGWRIALIVLTHAHWDHLVAAARLRELTGARVAVHSQDAPLAAHPVTLGMRLPFEIPPVTADRLLGDEDQVEIGRLRFQVIHTPGHSLGSICLHEPAEKVVFTGDTLFDGACGRMDFPGGSETEMRKSLRMLGALPPETKVCPGHGPATTIGAQGWMDSF